LRARESKNYGEIVKAAITDKLTDHTFDRDDLTYKFTKIKKVEGEVSPRMRF
jgi:hypothetical protein